MSLLKPTFGMQVDIPNIENELKKMWRHTVDSQDAIPITKASTINLVILVYDEKQYIEISRNISFLLEHHPGRFIIIHMNEKQPGEQITAHAAFFCQYFNKIKSKTCCDLITLESQADGAALLPGIIIPLLLPDLPVVLWFPDSCKIPDDFKNVLKYTDRIILGGTQADNSLQKMKTFISRLLQLTTENNISDTIWAETKPWREAIAQLFDIPSSLDCLNRISKIELHIQDNFLSRMALYLPGWMANRLEWSFSKMTSTNNSLLITLQKGNRQIDFHIIKSDTQQLFIFPETQENATVFRIIEQDKVLKSMMIKNGKTSTINYINLNNFTLMEKMCAELDYPKTDVVYESTLRTLNRMFHATDH